MFRTIFSRPDFEKVKNDDIDDLHNLIGLVDPAIFKARRICLLNPTFGETAGMMRGADADLLIDNMIVDIKTTKVFTLRRKDFNQLLGYYFLHEIDGAGLVTPKPRVTQLGIYFSRFAYLHVFDLKKITDIEKISTLVSQFKNKVHEIHTKRQQAFEEWKIEKAKEDEMKRQTREHFANQREMVRLFHLKNRKQK